MTKEKFKKIKKEVEKSQKKFKSSAKKNCPRCEGTGIYYAPDGHDDVIGEICECTFEKPKPILIHHFPTIKANRIPFAEEIQESRKGFSSETLVWMSVVAFLIGCCVGAVAIDYLILANVW